MSTKTRRRVASFTTKARALLDAADWPEGVKVIVDSQTGGDAIHVYQEGGGGRCFWYLDARYLESADPAEVRATAIRRLESQGRDPKYSEKSRAEDLALAALLKGPVQPVFTTRATVTSGEVDGIVVMVNGHDLLGVFPSLDVPDSPWSLGYWDASSGEWVDADYDGDFCAQLVKYLALGEETFTVGEGPS